MPRLSSLLALVLLGCVVAAGSTWAAFSKTTSNASNTVTAKRIFSGTRSTTAWAVNNQANGTATDATDAGAVAGDNRTWTTGTWSTTFASTRYIESTFSGPLPAGLSVSGLTYNFTYKGTTSTDTVCLYFETRRASTGAVLATHGSAASPIQCTSGTASQSISTPMPEITTSDDANDLAIRTYVTVSGSHAITGDLGTITGTAGNSYGSFTLYETKYIDSAAGFASTFPYALASADATAATYSSWSSTFGTSRFLGFTFPNGIVPSGATITAATLTFTYRSSSNKKQTCVYYEAWSGATLLGSHGSSTTPYSCDDTQNNYNTDSVPLTEVDTAAKANGLLVKVFGKDSGSGPSDIDQVKLSITYSLD